MRGLRFGLAAAILVLLALLVACGGGGQPSGASPSPQIPEPGALPRGFPGDFPAYPEADVVGSRAIAENYYVLWVTEDGLSDVVTFYEEALAEGRWETIEKMGSEADGRVLFRFSDTELDAEGIVAIVTRTPDSGTEISVRLPSSGGGGEGE